MKTSFWHCCCQKSIVPLKCPTQTETRTNLVCYNKQVLSLFSYTRQIRCTNHLNTFTHANEAGNK